jgi:hypothetical protein
MVVAIIILIKYISKNFILTDTFHALFQIWNLEAVTASIIKLKSILFLSFLSFFFFLTRLGFELRVSCLHSRHSYCLSHTSSPFSYFGDGGLVNNFPGLASNQDLLILASLVASVISTSHWHSAKLHSLERARLHISTFFFLFLFLFFFFWWWYCFFWWWYWGLYSESHIFYYLSHSPSPFWCGVFLR